MDKKKLTTFLLKARSKTYAGSGGKVTSAFKDSEQLEYKEGKFFYRDLYYVGNGLFMGLETVYFNDKPVWSMSYYGDFKKMTEEEADEILRGALVAKKDTTRLWHKVEWRKNDFKYLCIPYNLKGIDEIAGTEEIYKRKEKVYFFFYAGGLIG